MPTWTIRGAEIVVPARREDLVCEELDGEAILMDPDTDRHAVRLNQTALLVWRQCDGRTTGREIATRLTRDYDVDFETALDHVEQLVAAFAEQSLFASRHP